MLGCSGMELWVYTSAFFLLICCFPITKSDSNRTECGPGLKTIGVTIPSGDILLHHGQPLEIFCTLSHSESSFYNSSSLLFYHDNVEVSDEFVTRINKTTIRLYVRMPPPSDSIYYCKLRTSPHNYTAVCLNYVLIGYPPKPVQNFTCISRNWQSLNCSWVPAKNYIKTSYQLSYFEKMKNRKIEYHCPEQNLSHNYCVWNEVTEPVYRLALEIYHFTLFMHNGLGNYNQTFTIDHYSIVVPNKAVNLTLIEATPTSLCIGWERPVALLIFPREIVPRVKYQSKWDTLDNWQTVDTSMLDSSSSRLTLNITNLKYAHTLYDIRVLLKSGVAKDEPMWWSEPATITLRTKATVPGMKPKIHKGSFEIHSTNSVRDIYLYWQQIPKYMENGDNFEYKVKRIEEWVDGHFIERNNTPYKITKTYAKFANLTHNSLKFTIVSSNKEGYSADASIITVPSQDSKLPEPLLFTKIAHSGGVYELNWVRPNDDRIRSYTIFWCDNKQDRPYDCEGYLNWTNVGNVTEKNITLEEQKVYQFAISADGEDTSSGLLWAKCTVLPDQAKSKLKNTWIDKIGSTYFEIKWKLDCFERVKIHGFVIEYCPIVSPENPDCKEPMLQKHISGEPTHINITGLKPYTTYKAIVGVKTNYWEGMRSDYLRCTTLEAAPDKGPENIRVLDVTNSTINLSWTPPSTLNGVIKYYEIHYNNISTKVDLSKVGNKSDIVNGTLTNLSSFEIYNIYIVACTVDCSPPSVSIDVQTKIGSPSQLSTPSVKFINTTDYLYVSWAEPKYAGGPLDYYEIKIDLSDGNEPKLKKEKGTSIKIATPECKEIKSQVHYKVSVRAVNKDNSGLPYYGPWSPFGEDYCYPRTSGFSVFALIVIALVGVLIIFLVIGVFFRWAWMRFKAMQNVGVKLPPQLELNSVFKDKSGIDLPMAAHVCSASLNPHHLTAELLDEHITPDQQLLLDNKIKSDSSCDSPCDELDMALETGSGEGHVESSGCGSGHDSVSSSITAGTHITDSGTEADERPASPDVFSQSPRRLSDLRQRNITGNSSGGGGGSGEGYSRLAAAPTGYVTLPQSARTYVSNTHPWPHNGSVQQRHKDYVIPPPLSSSTYSKVSLLPATGLKVANSREHCTDTENSARNDGQLSINPASSI